MEQNTIVIFTNLLKSIATALNGIEIQLGRIADVKEISHEKNDDMFPGEDYNPNEEEEKAP